MSILQHLNTPDVFENGLVDIPDSPTEKEDPLASLQLNRHNPDDRAQPLASLQLSRESSPDFLGFSDSSTNRGFTPSPVKSITTSPRESLLRVSQPRTSKSKASLVWKKGVKYFETTIKVEPEDNLSPNKSDNFVEKVIINNQVKTKTEKDKNIKNEKDQQKSGTNKSKVVKIKQEPKIITSDRNKVGQKNVLEKLPSTLPKGTSVLKKYVNTKNKRLKNKGKKNCFKCETCGRAYKYLRGLRQHKKLECNVEPQFPCPYCPSRYRYRQNIREHVRNYHEPAFPKWYATHYVMPVLRQHKKLECNVEPQFPCPYCPSRYRNHQDIREHVRNYHEPAFPKWYATHYVMPVFDNIKS